MEYHPNMESCEQTQEIFIVLLSFHLYPFLIVFNFF